MYVIVCLCVCVLKRFVLRLASHTHTHAQCHGAVISEGSCRLINGDDDDGGLPPVF